MKDIVNGKLHLDLQIFLESNVPKAKEKSKQAVVLGVQDAALASVITETLSIQCLTSVIVFEILRGIRLHFQKFVKGYVEPKNVIKSQLALSHHYARAKMNINSHKQDMMLTEGVSAVDDLDKNINTLCARIKRMYSLHFPELAEIVPNSEQYIKCIKEIKDRKSLSENSLEVLQAILNNSETVQRIIETARSSMGLDITEADQKNLEMFVNTALSQIQRKKELDGYIKNKTKHIAPNLAEIIGSKDAARLITQAGSLTSLAKYPSSTVQILGAPKALFRSLKEKGENMTNFGSIKQSAVIGKSVKGQRARYLANKCCLASKIDCFSVIPTNKSKHLKVLVEQQMKLYEKDPEQIEKRKSVLAAKKAIFRKMKKERKRQKMLKS
ncbi:nucleolar protein 56 [Trichonephila inaurata madagascariensis]|uniref:Nucleolar protein 56 n=1 Tax=Trichonephila inaurata madagascariensis TaxID=2747483 RepID=A0A8X6IY85_9ARAC|nr:nucleolar protein 56 [Trichonephila inaurata madagascariensis]